MPETLPRAKSELMWIANETQPDMSNEILEVAQLAHNPCPQRWRVAHETIQYLKGTRDKEITYEKSA